MSTITLSEAQTQLTAWLAASQAVATGQEYMINGRRMRRVDAAEIRNQINYWSGLVQNLTNSSNGISPTTHSLASFS